eukprot:801050-Prymnesium_polylepis.1
MTLIALPAIPKPWRTRSDAGYALGGELERAPRLAPFAVSFAPFAHSFRENVPCSLRARRLSPLRSRRIAGRVTDHTECVTSAPHR